MSRSAGFVIGAALIASLGASAQAAARIERAPLQQLPVTTATQGLRLNGMLDLGRLSDAQPMHVVVSIPMRNKAMVNTILRRQITPGDALFGHFFTPAETRATFSPTGATLNAVATYLEKQGFTNIHATPDNQLVTADAPAGTVSRAFATEIHAFRNGSRAMYANVRPATVPASLHGMVLGVLGLNDLSMHPFLRYAPHRALHANADRPALTTPRSVTTPEPCNGVTLGSSCVANEYDAQQFRTAYDVAPNPPGNNTWGNTGRYTSIAIFTEGDMTSVLSDLKLYEKANNLIAITPKIIHPGIPSPDTSGADEFDLDTQSSTGIAQDVKNLYLYDVTSLTDSDTAVGFARFQTDDLAKAGSASFGECEILPELDGALTTDDEIFARAAVQGQTVFASSGDNGSGCPVVAATGVAATGPPLVSYPASSPYVVGVGGTSLIASATAGAPPTEQLAWMGSGGGYSIEESAPFWQQNVVSPACYAPSSIPSVETLRCVPDVAMDADNELSPALIYVAGATEGVGGTSLASPLALGAWAMIETEQSTANKLGFASPLLYQMYKNFTTANAVGLYGPAVGSVVPPATDLIGGLIDITAGANGEFVAAPGYDEVTGLGSFDVQKTTKDIPADYTHGP
jgi:subtilase family serine protease